MKTRPAKKRPPSRLKRLAQTGLALVLVLVLFVAWANYRIIEANRERIFSDASLVPVCDVALILGTSAFVQRGRANLHFESRMDAAAGLYRAGKVRHLLVSGDNRRKNYNEPRQMRAALIKRGIPETAITLDYAGFRTLDSVVRARQVFGLERCIIVTQRYHNSRALEIARASHLDAWGYCAPDVAFAHSFITECREVLARTLTVLDLYVWHRQPYFLGEPEPIRIARH
jgi:SanA protein